MPIGAGDGVRFPGAEVRGSYELTDVSGGPISSALEEQQELLPTFSGPTNYGGFFFFLRYFLITRKIKCSHLQIKIISFHKC